MKNARILPPICSKCKVDMVPRYKEGKINMKPVWECSKCGKTLKRG